MQHMVKKLLLMAVAGTTPVIAVGAESITYTYDAKGRLVKVVHSGAINNGVTAEYTQDKADNRKKVKVTGAQPGFLTVPISSFSRIRRRNP